MNTYVVVKWPSLEVIAVYDTWQGAYDYVQDLKAPLHIFEYTTNSHKRRSIWNYRLSTEEIQAYDCIRSYKYVNTSPELYAKAIRALLRRIKGLTIEELAKNVHRPVKFLQDILDQYLETNTSPIMDKGAIVAGTKDDSDALDFDGSTLRPDAGDTGRHDAGDKRIAK